MKRQKIIETLRNQIETANGKRHAHIVNPNMAEEIYQEYMKARAEVGSLHHDRDTVELVFDPNCVPNCYKWVASTTAVALNASTIEGNRPMAYETKLQTRPRGSKWKWKISFTPDGIHAAPEGFTKSGVKRC